MPHNLGFCPASAASRDGSLRRRDQVGVAAASVLHGGPLDLVLFCAGHFRELRARANDLAAVQAFDPSRFDPARIRRHAENVVVVAHVPWGLTMGAGIAEVNPLDSRTDAAVARARVAHGW